MIKTGSEYLKDNVHKTNIPEEYLEDEIGEMMDWYADYYYQEKVKGTLNLILEDMDNTLSEYHYEVVEGYLEELTQKIKGD